MGDGPYDADGPVGLDTGSESFGHMSTFTRPIVVTKKHMRKTRRAAGCERGKATGNRKDIKMSVPSAPPPAPSSPQSHGQKLHPFPFDCIVVTSPDAASAASAKAPLTRVLERRLKQKYPGQNIRIVSTYDSYGARCGSGGGTLAALEFASPGETVLVLHAGGDSSRCPTQMILGKAWTSLPSARYPNPTIWLIDQIQRLFDQAHFPTGTVVVAATDTLITFFEKDSGDRDPSGKFNLTWNLPVDSYADEALVLGVAVPAVLKTAKNHGVYVLRQEMAQTKNLGVADPLDVWQKPSITQLLEARDPPASFVQGVDNGDDDKRLAWIDTGVIVFLPKAVQVLYDLSNDVLAMCTRKGIKAAYERGGESTKDQSIEDFAKERALKVDLYTDILHSLSWPTHAPSEESPLQQILSQIPLKILVARQGRFLHLGTTQELVDFVTSGAYPQSSDDASTIPQDTISALSAYFSLQPRFQCWTDAQPLNNNVALQSTFPSVTTIGDSSHVEYCEFDGYESVKIGPNSMISGWRNPTCDSLALCIPGHISVQLLALEQRNGTARRFAYIVLGIQDGIKTALKHATIFGVPVSEFLKKTGMSAVDLGWAEEIGEMNHNLWNAMLHPMVRQETSFVSIYGWLDRILSDFTSVRDDPSFIRWLNTPRASLKQLHNLADAEMEWNFRQELEARVSALQQANVISHVIELLRERRHDRPCDLQWILELADTENATGLLLQILSSLENLASEELTRNNYDISGRAFMIASALLADFDGVLENHDDTMDESATIFAQCSPLILQLRSSSTRKVTPEERGAILVPILEYRRTVSTECLLQNLSSFSLVMERLSFCMNELSIASGYVKFMDPASDTSVCSRRTEPPVVGKWVFSSSPVRIDLAGGWTDTPPICYEFGGSVTGVAVVLDGRKPLSCRCRIVSGQRGILLRTENRNSLDGSLINANESLIESISDLSDFRDPLSDCALLKAALVCLCMATEEQIQSKAELQPLINRFCNHEGGNARFEIITASILPQGSGMGTSSILAAAVLASIAKCIGIGELDEDYLLHAVLMLEQLLTSGGGWQDQAHGIIPGIKAVHSKSSEIPVSISVERLPVGSRFRQKFENRMILAFTGKTRLAKNILQDVLRRWSRSTNEMFAAVQRNVQLANECKGAILDGNIDTLGRILLEYSKIKAHMAGEDSGAMPDSCKLFVSYLLARGAIKGACLCGAGGGGFMAIAVSEGVSKDDLSFLIQSELVTQHHELASFTLHDCQICDAGLTTSILNDGRIGVDDFSLNW